MVDTIEAKKLSIRYCNLFFFWPTLFKDVTMFVRGCDQCQRIGTISIRHEMTLSNILGVEIFDAWGRLHGMTWSHRNQHILVEVELRV